MVAGSNPAVPTNNCQLNQQLSVTILAAFVLFNLFSATFSNAFPKRDPRSLLLPLINLVDVLSVTDLSVCPS